METKEILKKDLKIRACAGQATPAPPIGSALGMFGVNIGKFVRDFNDRTRHFDGAPVTAIVTIYVDKSYTYTVRSPTVAYLLKRAAEVPKGSGVPNKEPVGSITTDQLY